MRCSSDGEDELSVTSDTFAEPTIVAVATVDMLKPAAAEVRHGSTGVGGGADGGGDGDDDTRRASHPTRPQRGDEADVGGCASSVARVSAIGVEGGAAGSAGEAFEKDESPPSHRVGVCMFVCCCCCCAAASVAVVVLAGWVLSLCESGGDGVLARRAGDCERRFSSAFTTSNSCCRVRSSISCARWMTLSHSELKARREGAGAEGSACVVLVSRRRAREAWTRLRSPESTRLGT